MKIPFLHNVRRGLATNSSSSHSLVFHAKPVSNDRDIETAKYTDTKYGWDHFILRSLGDKLMYALTSAIGQHWYEYEPNEDVVQEARDKWGDLFPEFDDDEYWRNAISGYVDHQSRETDIHGLVEKVRDPHVVVHGGNDNGGYPDIEYGWDGSKETQEDYDLPAGAHREMLG